MKKLNAIYVCIIMIALFGVSCTDILDLNPKDKIPAEVIFSDPTGVELYVANLYSQLPIEDFNFSPPIGFNASSANSMGSVEISGMYTDEGCHSSWAIFYDQSHMQWWTEGYKLNRDVNLMIEAIPTLNIEEEQKNAMTGEAAFIRAYTYFALAKRYGGVSLIKEAQEYSGDIESLKVPRSTEKETWDFVLEECDRAIDNLPESWSGDERRTTKWAALALKSRAALYAASIAKYWNEAPLSGDAVDQKLVGGMTDADADRYYEACIQASEQLIRSDRFSLYKPNPANPEEAIKNYQEIFENPGMAASEAIFIKGFGLINNAKTSHNYDIWYGPNQTTRSWPHPGRFNPTLDFVDLFENYDNPGNPAPIVTRTDGNITDVNGFSRNIDYIRFDNPEDIFRNKDARFFAILNYPGAEWKSIHLVIQGGLVRPDGTSLIETMASYDHNGKTYHTYGGSSVTQYSGFDTYGANMTRTGFLMKKFLSEKVDFPSVWFQSTTDFIDMRYAEVLLNYAEAIVESGYNVDNAQEKAKTALNSIRRRAAHTVDIPLTLDNVLRERRIELAFENRRIWDLIRRREYHQDFNNRRRLCLLPLIDLRGDHPQYIFVRKLISRDFNLTFQHKAYYRAIPGVSTTGVVQNPQY
jgi:hypothetical protein